MIKTWISEKLQVRVQISSQAQCRIQEINNNENKQIRKYQKLSWIDFLRKMADFQYAKENFEKEKDLSNISFNNSL